MSDEAARYWVRSGEREKGPYSLDQLEASLRDNVLARTVLVRAEGSSEARPLAEVLRLPALPPRAARPEAPRARPRADPEDVYAPPRADPAVVPPQDAGTRLFRAFALVTANAAIWPFGVYALRACYVAAQAGGGRSLEEYFALIRLGAFAEVAGTAVLAASFSYGIHRVATATTAMLPRALRWLLRGSAAAFFVGTVGARIAWTYAVDAPGSSGLDSATEGVQVAAYGLVAAAAARVLARSGRRRAAQAGGALALAFGVFFIDAVLGLSTNAGQGRLVGYVYIVLWAADCLLLVALLVALRKGGDLRRKALGG